MPRYKDVFKVFQNQKRTNRTESTDVKGTVFWRDYPFNPNDNRQGKKVSQS